MIWFQTDRSWRFEGSLPRAPSLWPMLKTCHNFLCSKTKKRSSVMSWKPFSLVSFCINNLLKLKKAQWIYLFYCISCYVIKYDIFRVVLLFKRFTWTFFKKLQFNHYRKPIGKAPIESKSSDTFSGSSKTFHTRIVSSRLRVNNSLWPDQL